MSQVIDILENAHTKLSKLQFDTQKELIDIMWALDILRLTKVTERIVEDETDLFEFIINLGFIDSKSNIRKLIKSNGFKINNKIANNFDEIEWVKLNKIEFAVLKKGKNDFDIIFKNFEL